MAPLIWRKKRSLRCDRNWAIYHACKSNAWAARVKYHILNEPIQKVRILCQSPFVQFDDVFKSRFNRSRRKIGSKCGQTVCQPFLKSGLPGNKQNEHQNLKCLTKFAKGTYEHCTSEKSGVLPKWNTNGYNAVENAATLILYSYADSLSSSTATMRWPWNAKKGEWDKQQK